MSPFRFASLLVLAVVLTTTAGEIGRRQWFMKATWERRLLTAFGVDCEFIFLCPIPYYVLQRRPDVSACGLWGETFPINFSRQ